MVSEMGGTDRDSVDVMAFAGRASTFARLSEGGAVLRAYEILADVVEETAVWVLSNARQNDAVGGAIYEALVARNENEGQDITRVRFDEVLA